MSGRRNYGLPLFALSLLAWSVVRGAKRSFGEDSRQALRQNKVKLRIANQESAPQHGPALVVMNHYQRAGFGAWWIAMSVSAAVPGEMHWVMTAAWTDMGSPGDRLKASVSEWLFPRLAAVYSFTSMPPMPPRPHEAAARARAVRQVLSLARRDPNIIIGLAPEGMDNPAGGLMVPPPGVGRFMLHLAELGCTIIPVGFFEEGAELVLSFGPAVRLARPEKLAGEALDRWAAERVMRGIAVQLPENLRGSFQEPPGER